VTHFTISTPTIISGSTEVTVAKFCVLVEYIKCLAYDDRLLFNGRGQSYLTRFLIAPAGDGGLAWLGGHVTHIARYMTP